MIRSIRTAPSIIFATGAVVGFSFGAIFGAFTPRADADAPMEDEPGWSCAVQGNRVCGPANSEAKTPGCYSDAGVLVAVWPCHVKVDANGDGDVYSGSGLGW